MPTYKMIKQYKNSGSYKKAFNKIQVNDKWKKKILLKILQ